MQYDFIHFSDCQLIPAGKVNFDINPLLRLEQCIDSILKECFDAQACFITGDLTHWGEVKAYRELEKVLARLPMPYFLLMGNHDSRSNFLSVFPEHPKDTNGYIQFCQDTAAGRLICLDTLDAGKRGGYLCQKRLNWLKKQLLTDAPVYLFMHHPPFKVGLPSMDNDDLQNRDEFFACIEPHKANIRHIFFGHLHRQVSGNWHDISYSCPPSLVHQTPFDFVNDRVSELSLEPPLYHRVFLDDEQVVIHARDFQSDQSMVRVQQATRYFPKTQ